MSEQAARPRRQAEEEQSELPTAQESAAGFDDILDDIDSILEENATSFVQGFVQKGGQ